VNEQANPQHPLPIDEQAMRLGSDPHQLHTRTAAPTSVVAAYIVDVAKAEAEVMDIIRARGDHGATASEIRAMLPKYNGTSTLSARWSALLGKGLIDRPGAKRANPGGNPEFVMIWTGKQYQILTSEKDKARRQAAHAARKSSADKQQRDADMGHGRRVAPRVDESTPWPPVDHRSIYAKVQDALAGFMRENQDAGGNAITPNVLKLSPEDYSALSAAALLPGSFVKIYGLGPGIELIDGMHIDVVAGYTGVPLALLDTRLPPGG
jgi:hypothetical protein